MGRLRANGHLVKNEQRNRTKRVRVGGMSIEPGTSLATTVPGAPGNKPPNLRRPKGTPNVTVRDLVDKIIASGKPLPLTIMLENMYYFQGHALSLLAQAQDKFQTLQTKILAGRKLTKLEQEQLREANKLIGWSMAARHAAQDCAVDAAPYIHPRLANVTLDKGDESKLTIIFAKGDEEL